MLEDRDVAHCDIFMHNAVDARSLEDGVGRGRRAGHSRRLGRRVGAAPPPVVGVGAVADAVGDADHRLAEAVRTSGTTMMVGPSIYTAMTPQIGTGRSTRSATISRA